MDSIESIDLLSLTCKSLFDHRMMEQRRIIEEQKKEIEKLSVNYYLIENIYASGNTYPSNETIYAYERDVPEAFLAMCRKRVNVEISITAIEKEGDNIIISVFDSQMKFRLVKQSPFFNNKKYYFPNLQKQ